MGINKSLKAFFLDRDGVLNKSIIINGKPFPPKNIKELVIPSGVKETLSRLKKLGYLLIMITNQPDVATGKTSLKTVNEINNYLIKQLFLDDVYCCIHENKDNCGCRKPKIGMVTEATKKWNIDLENSYLVGDRWKDIQTGINVGLKTFLIDYNYDEKYVKPNYRLKKFDDILNVINFIK